MAEAKDDGDILELPARDTQVPAPAEQMIQQHAERHPMPSRSPSLPPTTTLEEDIRTQSQRDLNMTWENTQALISKVVVITTCVGVLIILIIRAIFPDRIITLPSEWWAVVGLVIGFYFGRTNHARSSGIARAPVLFRRQPAAMNDAPLDDRELSY